MSKRKKKILSAQEKAKNKERRDHIKEIRTTLTNIGFNRLLGVNGVEFKYDGRTSELDDIFVYENIILLVEYTTESSPNKHLANKAILYRKIIESPLSFITFLLGNNIFPSLNDKCNELFQNSYTKNHLRIKIIYCSKNAINDEIKNGLPEIVFFDYHIVKYFKSLSSIIKFSSRYEFMEFLGLDYNQCGRNILLSIDNSSSCFSAHILPEEKSSFKEGYKIISFYIDPASLLKRSYVLRQEGWRKKDNIGFYQRMLDSKKISKLRQYLSSEERVFINNIIATISENEIKLFKDKEKEERVIIKEDGNFVQSDNFTKTVPAYIEINNKSNIIGLIDGQHRTYAYYEGADHNETHIRNLREVQNLLVTAIIFPAKETKETRLKFESKLFLEINSTQKKVSQQIQQEIQLQINPFSTIAIGKDILNMLNCHGALHDKIEIYSYEKDKIKTASIVSFGLKPLIKIDNIKDDTLYKSWHNTNKKELAIDDCQNYELLNEYKKYCVEQINQLLSAFKESLVDSIWRPYNYKTSTGILTVTFINGILNLLRLLIQNDKLKGREYYKSRLSSISSFPFKDYKSSQYRRLGEDLFTNFFN